MKAKIDWYKEVLELEPNSKVFFPLARLQVEEGELTGAVATLNQGIARHPDFLEARLLLVDVLQALGREEDIDEQVSALTRRFVGYTAFWKNWARTLQNEAGGRDPALALQFLAAFFSGKPLSWSEVIERGLLAVSGAEVRDVRVSLESATAPEAETMPLVQAVPVPPDTQRKDKIAALRAVDVERRTSVATPVTLPVKDHTLDAVDEDEDEDEVFSLRTRTMADLLAEQGDYSGAMDIYRELHAGAAGDRDKDTLATLIAEMQTRIDERNGRPADGAARRKASGPATPADASEEPPSGGLRAKSRLISALETLARRLEARAAAPAEEGL